MPQPAREIDVEVLPKHARTGRAAISSDDPLVALIARVMDTLFQIPGTKIRFGLDPLIGLIPGLGSPASAFISLLLIARSAQSGVPNAVLLRMAVNVAINSLLNAVPVVGDAASVFYRSNAKNHELMLKHSGTRRPASARDWLFVIGLMTAVVVFVIIMIVGTITLMAKFWGLLTGH